MKTIRYVILLLMLGFMFACSEDDSVNPSGEDLFPKMEDTKLDKQLVQLFKDYNTRVEFRYIKNLIPTNWEFITPVKEELVMPISHLLIDMWINPLVLGSSKEFVELNSPKMLVYVGSPSLTSDGNEILGEAEGGTLVRFTDLNTFDDESIEWITEQLHVAYHEYAHIIHQRFGFPDEYRKVTPDNYTEDGWTGLIDRPYAPLQLGFVTDYSAKNPQEDFVELFTECLLATEERLDFYFKDEVIDDSMSLKVVLEISDNNKGRALLRAKRDILKKYMHQVGLDMDVVRKQFQKELADKVE